MTDFDPDAHITLHTSTGEHRLDRDNSALFTHLGGLAMYDHIFIQTNPGAEDSFGAYIFRHNPSYRDITGYMVENAFPMHLNATDVAECDMDAFDGCVAQEASENIPDDWLD